MTIATWMGLMEWNGWWLRMSSVTERERELIASTQDRMLRDADSIFYGDDDGGDERVCGNCASFSERAYRDVHGEEWESRIGCCATLDVICEGDAPSCRWWSE